MTEELLKHIVQEKKAYLDSRTAYHCEQCNEMSAVLVGKEDSVFLNLVAKRCKHFGIAPIFQYPKVDILRTPSRCAVVFDTDDKSVNALCHSAVMLSDVDCVRTTGMSSVAEAIFELLRGANMIEGKSICIIGRGHAVQGLAEQLTRWDATVTVCHSKTKLDMLSFKGSPQMFMYPVADVVICAAPNFNGHVCAKELVIDISGAAKDKCVNKDAVYFAGIGPLTIAVLVNRIAVYIANRVCGIG